MTVAGAGAQTGSDWANALSATAMGTALNTTLQPGDTLYLGGPEISGGADYGDKRFTITASGTAAAQKRLVGVDRGFGYPTFVGIQSTRSYTTLTLADTVSYWTIQNIVIKHRDMGVATSGAGHLGLVFENLTARDIRSRGFSLADCDGMLLQNCRAERYSARGFVISNACDGIIFRNCVADFTGTGDVDDPAWRAAANSDPVGFDFHVKNSTAAPNTSILMEDCVAMNNDEDTADTTDYEQGDGIKFEQSNDGITMIRCLMLRNQDGGCDLKGSNQLIEDCISANNKRYGFKVWYEGTFTNCAGVNNGARQMQVGATTGGHSIYANFCTFHCASTSQVGIALESSANTVYLNDSIISFAGSAGTYNSATVVSTNSIKLANTANTANAPMYVNPVLPWDGVGDDFDNRTYGLTKGYNSIGSAGATILGEADTHVWDGAATTNYGTATSLIVKDATGSGWDRISYLRFPVAALSGPANSAVLRLKVTSIASEGPGPRTIEIRQLADDSWSETGVTWNNRPSPAGTLIATIDAGTVGQEYSIDVTHYVNSQIADGKASFVLVQPSGVGRYVSFGSRESAGNEPALDID
jgi:hypothetical protein